MAAALQPEIARSSVAERHFVAIAAVLLAAMAAAQFAAAALDSQTIDEGYHLRYGYSFLKTGRPNIATNHPQLAQAFAALPLLFFDLRIPPRPTTANGEVSPWDCCGSTDAEFLYRNTQSAETILFMARSIEVLLTLGLGAFVAWWTRGQFGAAAGLGALALFAFDPNFIAHGHYATTDIAATFGFLGACLSWGAFLRTGRRRHAVICGLATGLALAVKFSALVLLPLYGFLYLMQGYRQAAGANSPGYRCSIGHLVRNLCIVVAVAAGSVWAAFAFETGPILPPQITHEPLTAVLQQYAPTLLPTAILLRNPRLAHAVDNAAVHWPIPAPSFLRGVVYLSLHNARGHRSYLLGVAGGGGWWYYFPVVALVKTPAGTLLLFLLATAAAFAIVSGAGARAAALRILRARQEWFLITIPPLIYFALCVRSHINLGIRHLLPVYPFAFIWIAAVLFGAQSKRLDGLYRRAALVCLALVVVESAAAFPRYTAFFNLPSGGRANGARYVVDSNLDWGQDMFRLRDYLARRGVSNVCLASFGNAPPEHFGIHPKPIPASLEAARAEGCLVVMGLTVMFEWQPFDGRFDWLQKLEHTGRVGDAFWVYDLKR